MYNCNLCKDKENWKALVPKESHQSKQKASQMPSDLADGISKNMYPEPNTYGYLFMHNCRYVAKATVSFLQYPRLPDMKNENSMNSAPISALAATQQYKYLSF